MLCGVDKMYCRDLGVGITCDRSEVGESKLVLSESELFTIETGTVYPVHSESQSGWEVLC